MAQETNQGAGSVMDDPKTMRAEMAKTRATLGRELGALKSRVFGTPAKGAKSMSASKAKSARPAKKASKAKKAKGSSGSTKAQVTKVLKQVLTGAAMGAMKGAAEVIVPKMNETAKVRKQKH